MKVIEIDGTNVENELHEKVVEKLRQYEILDLF